MAGNGVDDVQYLAPPAVAALRQEARAIDSRFSPSRSPSLDDMREEREELKEAAEQTLNVIVDLGLDGRVKWVSPSWKQVVGTSPESIEGRMISDLLVGNKNVFHDTIESMKENDSYSRFIRFAVRLGPDSVLKYSPEPPVTESIAEETGEAQGLEPREEAPEQEVNRNDVLHMEGQGIMVFDRTADGTGHVGFLRRSTAKQGTNGLENRRCGCCDRLRNREKSQSTSLRCW